MKNAFWVVAFAMAVIPFSSAYSQGVSTATTSVSTGSDLTPKVYARYRSFNDSGRMSELQDPAGRSLKTKNEFYLGGKTDAGWGMYAMFVETGTFFKDQNKNKMSPDDPSLSLLNPFYDNGWVKVNGWLRQYFPVSDNSTKNNTVQTAYYTDVLVKMPNRVDLFNEQINRYFSQSKYGASDAQFAAEDWTFLGRKMVPWCNLGVGHHFVWEVHPNSPNGRYAEFFPYADLIPAKGVTIQPKVFFPILEQNTVAGAPAVASAAGIQYSVMVNAQM